MAAQNLHKQMVCKTQKIAYDRIDVLFDVKTSKTLIYLREELSVPYFQSTFKYAYFI